MKASLMRNILLYFVLVLATLVLAACQKKQAYPSLAGSSLAGPDNTGTQSTAASSQPETGPGPSTLLPTGTVTESLAGTSSFGGPGPSQTSQEVSATSSVKDKNTGPETNLAPPAPTANSQPAASGQAPGTNLTSPGQATTKRSTTEKTVSPAPGSQSTTTRNTTTRRTTPSRSTTTTLAPTSNPPTRPDQLDYRQLMRDFVIRLSDSGKAKSASFLVIAQNGEDIIQEGSQVQKDYMSAVDGIGKEDFLYGASRDDVATSSRETSYSKRYLDQFLAYGKKVMVTDYSSTPAKMQDSYTRNNSFGYISFAADQRELNSIPTYPQPIYANNSSPVNSLAAAKNFLYLINPEKFRNKEDYLSSLSQTDYDLFIIDLFYEGSALTRTDLARLKQKPGGGRRLAIAYMSIGEAEDYRYYWQGSWRSTPPAWLMQANPSWPGNYLVKYWDPAWQAIIIDNSDSYLNRIISAGFDGVYLDLIDAYEYFR